MNPEQQKAAREKLEAVEATGAAADRPVYGDLRLALDALDRVRALADDFDNVYMKAGVAIRIRAALEGGPNT